MRVCFGFITTNNESLHRMLTRKVLKTGKVSYETYGLGAALAVIQYNDGVTALANILKRLVIDPRKRIFELFQELFACTFACTLSSKENIVSKTAKVGCRVLIWTVYPCTGRLSP